MKKIEWTRIGQIGKRLKEACSIELEDVERIAVALMASGANRKELASGIEAVLEDVIDWTVLLPGPAGLLLERAEDPALRMLAGLIAKSLRRTWKKLKRDEQAGWAAALLEAAADK